MADGPTASNEPLSIAASRRHASSASLFRVCRVCRLVSWARHVLSLSLEPTAHLN